MQSLKTEDIKTILRELKGSMDKNQELLGQLDGVMGDGDLGLTMTKAFTAAAEEAERSDEPLPGKLLMRLGAVIAKAAPSTMGTLVATGFMRGGKALESVTQISSAELATFFDAFVKGIMERGKSAPGNKTIIDTLYPAARALLAAASAFEPLPDAAGRAFVAAYQGLEDSKQMKAQYGRAAYYQDASIGRQDGGATVGLLIVEGFYKVIAK
jgi:phosphoenolpyruvate---glycerone phosphotransferase subunit DhaL